MARLSVMAVAMNATSTTSASIGFTVRIYSLKAPPWLTVLAGKFEDSKHRDEQAALGYIKQAEAIPHPDAATCACGRLLLKDYIEQHLWVGLLALSSGSSLCQQLQGLKVHFLFESIYKL
jgi:hypothetical protein